MIIENKFNSTKIIFGNNQRSTVLKIIKKKTALIVCSKRTKREIILDKNFSFINIRYGFLFFKKKLFEIIFFNFQKCFKYKAIDLIKILISKK